jgi:hypothetical protein
MVRAGTLSARQSRDSFDLACAAQELDEVPATPYDTKQDAVTTECGIISCKDT